MNGIAFLSGGSIVLMIVYAVLTIWLLIASVLMPIAIWRMRRELIECREAIEHMASSRIYDEPSADPKIAAVHATRFEE